MSTLILSVTICLLLALLLAVTGLYQKITTGICKSKKRLDGKTAIVTGGTSGIGLEIATDFAERGARVIIACPFQEEGTNACRDIINKTGNEKVIFKMLDLASLNSVRTFSQQILETENRLDILMNNAGVGVSVDVLTSDGMNFIMQVNYFGHFLLTLLLLPLLKKSGKPSEPSRIVNTASKLARIGNIDIDNINRTDYWYKIQIYANSKLCMLLFAHELSKRLVNSNVVINSIEPGLLVATRIFYSASTLTGLLSTFVMPYIFNTAWEGAQTPLHVALDTKAGQVSGQLFTKCKLSRASHSAYSDKLSRLLWDESLVLVKFSDK